MAFDQRNCRSVNLFVGFAEASGDQTKGFAATVPTRVLRHWLAISDRERQGCTFESGRLTRIQSFEGADQIFGAGRDPLGRHYTDPGIGRLFVGLFDRLRVNSILDLGSGGGSLAMAAARRWKDAPILTVDIDTEAAEAMPSLLRSCGHRHLVADALDENLPDLVGGARFDLAVCNPPYTRTRWRAGFRRILDEAGLSDLHELSSGAFGSDIMFVAQILRLTEPGAEVGVIVPDGFVSTRRSRVVRHAMLKRVRVTRVVQLPRGSFSGTQALAHAVIFRNEPGSGNSVEIGKLDGEGVSSSISIPSSAAEARMDYGHYCLETGKAGRRFTLREVQAEIVRGSISSTEARECGASAFHTDGFVQANPLAYRLSGEWMGDDRPGRRLAEPGDILLARVDRELHRKVCMVAEGRAVLTDCVYRVRVPTTWRIMVARALMSESGRAALARASRGVGARMLNRDDLLDLELVAV